MSVNQNILGSRYPKTVSILYGAPETLVSQRETYGTKQRYETNRCIKYWSTWFLLKSLTTTSFIQDWPDQKKYILTYLQMGIKTFRKHLSWLESEQLISDASNTDSLRLISYDDAAKILKIEYTGTFHVAYNPKKNKNAKQTFQYLLRMEEFEYRKKQQVDAIMRKLERNPKYKNDIVYYICQMGADYERLMNDPLYFIARMLELQVKMFREGSEFLNYVMEIRADINRSVICIKRHHGYRSKQSVSYMKRKMKEYGYAFICPRLVESDNRSRLIVPPNEETSQQEVCGKGLRNGYIWIPAKKKTAWRLCDNVKRSYEHNDNYYHLKTNLYAA